LWISSGSLAQFRSIRLPAVIPRDLGTEAAGKNKARDHEGACATQFVPSAQSVIV